jgi:hypothetical protein
MMLFETRPVSATLPLTGVSIIVLITFAFVGVALLISAVEGIPFTAPQGGDIPGLHTNYWVPPIVAAIGYMLLQFMAELFNTEKRSLREIGRHAADDYLLLGLFVLIIYVHFNMKMWIPVINPSLHDQDFFAIDQAARPIVDLFMYLRDKAALLLPGADLWYMVAFIAMFVLSFISHALGRRRYHYHNMVALLLFEIMGPFSYFIAPAVGPFIFEHGSNALATKAELQMYDVYQQVREGGAAWIAQNGGHFFAQPLAAMPSLHVGGSLIIAYYAIKGRLLMVPLAIITLFWVIIESVASRWHYLIDLPPGILLAALAILGSNYICRDVVVADTSRKRFGRARDVNT